MFGEQGLDQGPENVCGLGQAPFDVQVESKKDVRDNVLARSDIDATYKFMKHGFYAVNASRSRDGSVAALRSASVQTCCISQTMPTMFQTSQVGDENLV